MLPEPGRFPGASGSEKKKAFSGIQGYVNNALKLRIHSSNFTLLYL